MVTALDGVRVLELAPTRQSAYATRMLADMGAQVTLIEPSPGGEFAAARFEHELDRITFHARKQSVVLDIERYEARSLLARFVKDTDVVVRSIDDASAERIGIDEEVLRESGLL